MFKIGKFGKDFCKFYVKLNGKFQCIDNLGRFHNKLDKNICS